MKIKIEYEFDAKLSNPFCAKTVMDGFSHCGLSDESFEKAELNLIRKIEDIIRKKPPDIIPSAKEIEIGE